MNQEQNIPLSQFNNHNPVDSNQEHEKPPTMKDLKKKYPKLDFDNFRYRNEQEHILMIYRSFSNT